MICDAHVHMGYYSRKGWREPFYYSPRRVFGVLDRCGVEEFIVSSTCAQVEEIGIDALVREAREMKRLAGRRAHVFFWLSGHLYDEDHEMHWLDLGLFEGFKFHEGETPWMQRRQKELRRILSVANERGLPVMFHAGPVAGCCPSELSRLACDFPSIHFNFAHCRPMDEMAKVIADCPNVWADTAYMALDEFPKLSDYDWHGRLMFGTDLPVWQAHENCGLTERYREYVRAFRVMGLAKCARMAFRDFCKRSGKMDQCPQFYVVKDQCNKEKIKR
ncbi:MAG: amidohydrolase family protein [Kiritimatiellae bacterium]|nr:amidohydrolase family protein [Kiritimatiellia bacterium]